MNRERVLQAFYSFTENYDCKNIQIGNKKRHTLHVANNSEYIAKELDLSEKDVELAWLIGILHDIGRFEQVNLINGFNDTTGVNHAELGVRILFQDGLIKNFLDEKTNFDIIQCAVWNHNKLELPDSLDEREALFCNIIRDADKADNFRGFHENDFESFHEHSLDEVQNSKISDAVINCFMENRTIPVGIMESAADFFLMPYALYFGIVYDCSFRLIEEQGYYRRMLDFSFHTEENRYSFNLIKRELIRYMGCVDRHHHIQ